MDDSRDYLIIDRLLEFYPRSWAWNRGESITLNDVSDAIANNIPEESSPYGDNWKYPPDAKPTSWHIGRILYYINHPENIRDVEVDNLTSGYYDIYPIPVIVDGNHRLAAAAWLRQNERMNRVSCIYSGRTDLLDYLSGKSDIKPE